MNGGDFATICALAQGGAFARAELAAISTGRLVSLIGAGLTVEQGRAEEILCFECDEPHLIAVDWNSASQSYRGFCAEAGFVDLAPADVALLSVDREWLSEAMREALVLGGEQLDTLIAGHAWYLGKAVTQRIEWNVILLAGLNPLEAVEALSARARTLPSTATSVVLISASEIGGQLLAPYNIWFVRLQDIMTLEYRPSVHLSVNREHLVATLRGFIEGSAKPKRSKGG